MNRPRSSALGVLLASVLGASAVARSQSPSSPGPAPVGPKARPAAADEPRMLTAEESARRGKGSAFTGGPAAGKYGETVPWAELPPWKRASFYGIRSVAQTVVYVVDCSGSMADDGRLARAKMELRRSVADLQFPQRFLVIFFDDEPIPMPGDALRSADLGARDSLAAWLRTVQPGGGTDPRAALSMALGLNPDAVYLLSDGAFPEGTVEAVAARNKRKIPIHCIDLAGGTEGDGLKRIAGDSGGQYASRP